jgi:hypothetical protein
MRAPFVAALAALAVFASCTGPAAKRVARSFTVYAGSYSGDQDYPVGGKRDFDARGQFFAFSLDLGAALPPDPLPVYSVMPDTPAAREAGPHRFVRDEAGCIYCRDCGLTPDEIASAGMGRAR